MRRPVAREVYGPNIIGEGIAGTIVATGGTVLLAMAANLETPVFSVSTCMCASIYYSVGRRLSLPGGKKDENGEDIQMKKWSKVIGQVMLVDDSSLTSSTALSFGKSCWSSS